MGILKYNRLLGYVIQYTKYEDSLHDIQVLPECQFLAALNQVWNKMGYNEIIIVSLNSFLFCGI